VSGTLVVQLTDQQLEELATRVAAKLQNGNGHHPPEEPDKLLDAAAAAERLGVTVRWIYGRSSSLPFAVKLPNSRAVRFSARGIGKWLARKAGQ